MNKSELIDAIAAKKKNKKADAKNALEAFMATTSETLKDGGKVSLVGFGTFSVSERGARQGRNPKTGATMTIPAKKVVKFKAGAEMGR